MTGCGAATARRIDQCECTLPPGHPSPHRCDDCGLTWYERPAALEHELTIKSPYFGAGPEGSGGGPSA